MEVIAESTRSEVGMVDGYWVIVDPLPRWRNSALMESVEIRTPIRNKMGNGGGDDDGDGAWGEDVESAMEDGVFANG